MVGTNQLVEIREEIVAAAIVLKGDLDAEIEKNAAQIKELGKLKKIASTVEAAQALKEEARAVYEKAVEDAKKVEVDSDTDRKEASDFLQEAKRTERDAKKSLKEAQEFKSEQESLVEAAREQANGILESARLKEKEVNDRLQAIAEREKDLDEQFEKLAEQKRVLGERLRALEKI